jgi:heme-degrading monooxygenase HmoA
MFVLHIELKVKAGSRAILDKTFLDRFYPAVSEQGGFVAAQLLRSNDDDTNYRLCLSFDQEAAQQKWVATDLHQEVWPFVAGLCDGFSVAGYTTV